MTTTRKGVWTVVEDDNDAVTVTVLYIYCESDVDEEEASLVVFFLLTFLREVVLNLFLLRKK